MTPSIGLAICRHEFRILRTDASTPIFMIFMPLLMMAFMRSLFRVALVSEGYAGANGSEQAVPGMAVAFSAFFTGYVGFSFFRDHGWGAWERLRASQASSLDIMFGKVIPPLSVMLVQMLVLFTGGVLLFDLTIAGSLVAFTLVIVALCISLMAFGMALTAISRTSQQLNAYGSLGSMLFAMLGGAFVPISAIPGWARAVSPVTPTYWAMRGLRSVILDGGGMSEVALPVAVLLASGAVFTVLTALKFRFEESKIYYG